MSLVIRSWERLRRVIVVVSGGLTLRFALSLSRWIFCWRAASLPR